MRLSSSTFAKRHDGVLVNAAKFFETLFFRSSPAFVDDVVRPVRECPVPAISETAVGSASSASAVRLVDDNGYGEDGYEKFIGCGEETSRLSNAVIVHVNDDAINVTTIGDTIRDIFTSADDVSFVNFHDDAFNESRPMLGSTTTALPSFLVNTSTNEACVC